MSIIPIGTSIAIAAADSLLSQYFLGRTVIDDIFPDVSVHELHDDRLVVTRNPVEQGADIADHSYKEPCRLQLICGWSNSSPQAGGDINYVNEVYQQLLVLQASRQPFTIVTVKRVYNDMLMTGIKTDTDQKTRNSMIVRAEFQEAIIVTTQTVTVPSADVQRNPQINGATNNYGAQSLQPANNFNASAAPQ